MGVSSVHAEMHAESTRTDALLTHLEAALRDSEFIRCPTPRQLSLHLLVSQSRRSHSLFPWATDIATNKIRVHDILLTASEDDLPIFALEANLYLFQPTGAKLLYISKVDTTGLSTLPSPAKTLTAAFLQWWLQHSATRLHIFARAASQYLFPASAENPDKKVLTDRQLTVWWKSVVSLAATSIRSQPLKGWYAIPGCEESETRRLLAKVASPDNLAWSYGQGFDQLPSPLSIPADIPSTIGDLVPSFPDDPKSRFLNSWASSRMNPSGEAGDWDDAYHASGTDDVQLVEQRRLERERLARHPSVADFWEHLAYRQECISGILVAFFAVTSEVDGMARDAKEIEGAPTVPHAASVKLWGSIHNVDYSLVFKKGDMEHGPVGQGGPEAVEEAANTSVVKNDDSTVPNTAPEASVVANAAKARIRKAFANWQQHVLDTLTAEYPASSADDLRKTFARSVSVPAASGEKRKAEEVAPAKVNVMQLKPRKKAKPTPPAPAEGS